MRVICNKEKLGSLESFRASFGVMRARIIILGIEHKRCFSSQGTTTLGERGDM
jgi:hypothetical protein